jgi:glycosyltransferase involved in cell wall biosynthesis
LRINVIIPVFNESDSIHRVLRDIPKDIGVEDVIVVNNGSTDDTAFVAAEAGGTVIDEPFMGYGSACLKGLKFIAAKPVDKQPDIVVFLDGDYSDYPGEMANLARPVHNGEFDLVIGSRAIGERQKGSMAPQQIFGNWLATSLIKFFYDVEFTDLGPFRAIAYDKLLMLQMKDRDYGWTVEMQVKSAKQNLRCSEVPVSYRPRIGKSKITGTIKGTVLAGYKIITTIFKYR